MTTAALTKVSTSPHGHATTAPHEAAAKDSTIFAKVGLYLYLVFIASWFLHLGVRVPALGAIRFDLLLVILISVLSVLTAANRTPEERGWTPARFVLILVGYAFLTLPFVQWPGSVLKSGFPEFVKAAVFCLFTATLVRDRHGLRLLLMVFVGCQSFRVIEPLYLHVTEGYWGSVATMANFEFLDRLAGSPYDVVNPNGLAFVIVTTLAFVHFLAPLTKIGRVAYMIYGPLAIWALLLTASRTGLLALSIVAVAIWVKSRHKLVLAAVGVTAILVTVPMLSADLADRYLSIFSSSARNAGTASERSTSMISGIMVATRRPLFGHGLGTSQEANYNFGGDGQRAHTLYVEAAQELGFVGLPLVIAFMIALARELNRTRAICRANNETGLVPAVSDALHVFFWMNVTFSLASYGLSGYEWYLMAGISAVLTRLSVQMASEVAQRPSAAAPGIHKALQGISLPGMERLRVAR